MGEKPLTAMKADLPPTEIGEEYFAVLCNNPKCTKPMAITRTWSVQIDEGGQRSIRPVAQPMICPHCSTESVYKPQQIRILRVTAPPVEQKS